MPSMENRGTAARLSIPEMNQHLPFTLGPLP